MPDGEVKVEPPVVDPAAPKKCDVIVISGRKERCEAAVEALKVRGHPLSSDWLGGRGARDNLLGLGLGGRRDSRFVVTL